MRTLIGTTLVAVLIGFSGIIAVEAKTAAEVNKTLDELFGEHAPYQAFFEKLKKAVVGDDRKTVASLVDYPSRRALTERP